MTDATFLLPSFAVFYFATRAAAAESRATAKWITAVVLFVITVFCRPTGCLVGVALICCVLFSPKVTRRRSVSFWRTMTVVVLLAATTFVSVAWIVSQPSRWRSTFMAPAVRVLSTRAAAGEVVEGHTYQRSPQGVAEYFALYVEKFARFFQVATGGFSRIHNAYELLFFVPLYACAIAAVAWMAMQRGIRGPEIAVLVALIEILTFAAFHAMTIVDYIWRYRLPVLPHLIFLAAFGAAQMQERLRRSPSEVNA